MDRTVDEILRDIRLNKKDITSPDVINEIYLDLNIKDILKICRLNRAFNNACKNEEMWKTKIWDEYGVRKKYGETWRETAQNLSSSNMINMNDKWYDGRTYTQLLYKALDVEDETSSGWDYLDRLKDDAVERNTRYRGNVFRIVDENTIKDEYDHLSQNALDIYKQIATREYFIIFATLRAYMQNYPVLPTQSVIEDYKLGEKRSLNIKLLTLIDPILYVIQFSSFDNEDLYKPIYVYDG
uniref:F-box-like family protein n=1 Tax=Pithovirus LCPAC406 TaxID=2506599 RepID=A0A481ZES0_9VIRU|nr:MAG: uncharacterized protein LCPAC406_01890 [Pithovirus LCPAC406]